MVYLHNGISVSLKKEGIPAVCDNIGEPGGHYAKCNQPATESQTLHDLTNTYNLKKLNL